VGSRIGRRLSPCVRESADNKEEIMKRLICIVHIFLTLAILSILLTGCAGSTQQTKMKTLCPKCGSYYDSSQGEEMFRYMEGL
jgi:cytochrome b561